jgi:hypothetical protein
MPANKMKDPKFSETIERCDARELGLVVIFEDVNFGTVQTLFDEQGQLLNQEYIGRVDKFFNELIWMARVLRHGRENVAPV